MPPVHASSLLFHSCGICIGSVVGGAEPPIPRGVDGSVVAFKKTVMQLMVKIGRIDKGSIFDQQLLESRMGKCRSQTPAIQMYEENNGMRWDYEMNQHRRDVDYVLYRVHGHAGPRTDLNVAVVQSMNASIQWRPMQQSMNQVEV